MSNISFGLNANRDLYQGPDGNLAMVTGLAAVQQDAECFMRAQFGEMVFQPLDGLPNLTDIWLQKNFKKWEAAARRALSNVSGVTGIQSLTYTVIGDTFSYVAIFSTVYSQAITISQAITGNPPQ